MKTLTRTVIVLFALDIAVCAGVTLAHPEQQQRIFSSVYFAALQVVLAATVVGCVMAPGALRRQGWAGMILHAGLVVVAVGGVLTYCFGKQGALELIEGKRSEEFMVGARGAGTGEKLGFQVELDRVDVQYDPHSEMWRSITSSVRITDGTGTHAGEISVNKPLSWGGYRLYQMGFDRRGENGPWVSYLHVSGERGYVFVYAGCGIVLLGLVMKLLVRDGRERETGGKRVIPRMLMVMACVVVWCGSARGEASVSEMERAVDGLRTMAVQYEGRIMPMESMCRDALRGLTGVGDVAGLAPKGCASHDAVFTYLSIACEPERWESAELFEIGYRPLREVFGKDRPARISIAQLMAPEWKTELKTRMEPEMKAGEPAHPEKQADPKLAEAVRGLGMHVQEFMQMADCLVIFPQEDESKAWLAPSELASSGGTEGAKAAAGLKRLMKAFRARDAQETRKAAEELRGLVGQLPGAQQLSPGRVRLEHVFSRLNPMAGVAWMYVAPLVFAIAALASAKRGLHATAFGMLIGVFVLHSAALAGRSYIAGRLPLANTYEYAVMTAWATVLLAIVFESHFRNGVFVFLGALLGSVSLAAASVAPISREVTPLMPVLRSTWLQYHVMTVFIGYAAFLLAFGVSGYYLLSGGRGRGETGRNLLHANDTLIRVGFLFLTLGIITGCIWANLSWGRYWGWDPKEVWALITWFVYVIYLHLESAGWKRAWVGPAASCVGFGFVVFTYLGVNYLLPGLHSYAS